MIRDMVTAWRALWRRPGLLAVAVLSLAVGIGINVAVFSVTSGALLRPMPYRDPERLAVIWHSFGKAQSLPAIHPMDYRDYKERAQLFEDFTLIGGSETVLEANHDPELVRVANIAANFFPFLGVEPALGRHFTKEEDTPSGPRAIWLGHDIWQRHFGGDPGVTDRSVDLDGTPHQIVGVLPKDFELYLPAEVFFVKRPQIFRPLRIDFARLPPRNFTAWTGLARLKRGVTLTQARQEMEKIGGELKHEVAEFSAGDLRVGLIPFDRDVLKGVRRGLWSLMGAVGFVLLIACGNVARLLLARGFSREGEFRLRAALGAGRLHLARSVLAEGLVISALGSVAGIALAASSLKLLIRMQAAAVPRLETVGLDVTVLAFAIGAALFASLLSALVPALRAAALVHTPGVNADHRLTGSSRRLALQDRLVVAQVALAVMVVAATGFMIQSFRAMSEVSLGFESRGLATMRLALPRLQFPESVRTREFFRELDHRLRALPGVTSMAGANAMPLSGSGSLQPFAYDAETARHWESATADHRRISPGFFKTMGAMLVAGREFEEADEEPTAPRRVIIDTALARRAFPGRAAVGERLQLEPDPASPNAHGEVVGVVSPLSLQSVVGATTPQIYEPGMLRRTRLSLFIRTTGDPKDLVEKARLQIADLAPGIAVQEAQSMDEVVSRTLAPTRLAAALMSTFGLVALLLSGLGIYAALGYAVSQRTHEIGIRMALSEPPSSLRTRVLSQGLRLIGNSLAIGVPVTMLLVASTRVVFYGVRWTNPAAYALAAVLMGLVGLAACWVPARRAARVDPLRALRHD